MVLLVVANPANEFVIATAQKKDSQMLIDREVCFYDTYMDTLSKLLLSRPIEVIGVIGTPGYVVKIMEEIKTKFPEVPVEGEGLIFGNGTKVGA